jgi:cell division transport system ATP-binding protein
MIRFENVTKQFPNETIALEKISFHIESGEFTFIVGPSGAGKTTILRLLLQELKPTSGTILIDKSDIGKITKKQLPDLRRQIGAVFQDYKLITDRTVAENVALVSEIVKQSKEEIEAHVAKILSLVGLEDKADLFPSQLSGGELQRTSIARALATQPKIIFADEPTGNLDPATAWEILNLLLMLNQEGTTVIVATHDLDAVKSLNKRIIELDQGRVVRDTKKPEEKKKKKKQEKEAEVNQKQAKKEEDQEKTKEEK